MGFLGIYEFWVVQGLAGKSGSDAWDGVFWRPTMACLADLSSISWHFQGKMAEKKDVFIKLAQIQTVRSFVKDTLLVPAFMKLLRKLSLLHLIQEICFR